MITKHTHTHIIQHAVTAATWKKIFGSLIFIEYIERVKTPRKIKMSKSDLTDCIETLEDIYKRVDEMYPKEERGMYEQMIRYMKKNVPTSDR